MLIKSIIFILCLGGIQRVKVRAEFEGQRDYIIVILLISTIILPYGNLYGLTLIGSLSLYIIMVWIQNIRFPIVMERELEESKQEASRNLMVINEMEMTIEEMKREIIPLREYRQNTNKEVLATLETFRDYCINNNNNVTLNTLESNLNLLLELYRKPPVERRKIGIDLFDNLHSTRSKKWALRYLKSIRKDINFGDGFDRELISYIEILEKDIGVFKKRLRKKRRR